MFRPYNLGDTEQVTFLKYHRNQEKMPKTEPILLSLQAGSLCDKKEGEEEPAF